MILCLKRSVPRTNSANKAPQFSCTTPLHTSNEMWLNILHVCAQTVEAQFGDFTKWWQLFWTVSYVFLFARGQNINFLGEDPKISCCWFEMLIWDALPETERDQHSTVLRLVAQVRHCPFTSIDIRSLSAAPRTSQVVSHHSHVLPLGSLTWVIEWELVNPTLQDCRFFSPTFFRFKPK